MNNKVKAYDTYEFSLYHSFKRVKELGNEVLEIQEKIERGGNPVYFKFSLNEIDQEVKQLEQIDKLYSN